MGLRVQPIPAISKRPGRKTSQLVRAYRLSAGLSYQQLADRSFLPAETVYAIEVGEHHTTTTEIWQLARGLAVNPRWLVYDINPDLR